MFGKSFRSLVAVITEHPLLVVLVIAALAVASYVTTQTDSIAIQAVVWFLALALAAKLLLDAVNVSISELLNRFTTRDIMVMAVLIAAGGVFKGYWGQVRLISESVGGPYLAAIVASGFYFWGVLANFLVRKPLSGTITMVLGGFIEILIGNPFGLPVLLFNAWEGFGPDVAFSAFGHRRHTVGVAILGGILAAVFGLGYAWLYYGFAFLGLLPFLAYIVASLAGGVIGGVVGYLLARALERIGVRQPADVVIES